MINVSKEEFQKFINSQELDSVPTSTNSFSVMQFFNKQKSLIAQSIYYKSGRIAYQLIANY